MNLRQIETFAAVMKCGTASRAAEVLGVSQPAVSRNIIELERSVGFPLFARIRNRLVPTPEARILYDDVEASFRGIDTIRASAARIRDRGGGEIRVASMPTLGHSIVPTAIAAFLTQHPDVRVSLLVLPSRDARDLIASGRFDIGLVADLIDVSGVLHQTFLSRDALCAIPCGHPLADREVIGPSDLDGEPFIAYSPEDPARRRLEEVLATVGALPRIVVQTMSATTALALVAAGVGLALVSTHSIGWFDRTRIVLKPFEPGVQVRTLLLLPADRAKSQLVREFIDALMAAR
ncbi:LysR substrate-binding domain-containing protein [Microbaculum marinum]|uniref:LysR substrate-binding domain-containing protein n=1 Tax=Microbaculum marinum TaxID=1764581 RepID=A0AAW9RZT4_9HYPH